MYDFYEPINQKHFITFYGRPGDNYKATIEFLNGKTNIENPFISEKTQSSGVFRHDCLHVSCINHHITRSIRQSKLFATFVGAVS